MTKHGDGTNITETHFKEFMIQLFGDNETHESVLAGFRLINKGDVAHHDRMKKVMEDYDINYITKTAPKSGEGWDYTAWTSAVFAR